jgi:hypothetical protein
MTDKSTLGILSRGGLLVPDVAALFTEERQAEENALARAENRDPVQVDPVSERTVLSFIDFSQPSPRGARPDDPSRTTRNRYEDRPMPLPIRIRSQVPVWVPDPDVPDAELEDVRAALRTWWYERRRREV